MNPTRLTPRALAARPLPCRTPAEIEPHRLLVGTPPDLWFAGWHGPYPVVTRRPELARRFVDARDLAETERLLAAWELRAVALPAPESEPAAARENEEHDV